MGVLEGAQAVYAPQLRAELLAGLDLRTVEILQHREQKLLPQDRVWLVRRALLTADLVSVTIAFLATSFAFEASAHTATRSTSRLLDDAAGMGRPGEAPRSLRA